MTPGVGDQGNRSMPWCVVCLQGFINVLNWYLLPPGEELSS